MSNVIYNVRKGNIVRFNRSPFCTPLHKNTTAVVTEVRGKYFSFQLKATGCTEYTGMRHWISEVRKKA